MSFFKNIFKITTPSTEGEIPSVTLSFNISESQNYKSLNNLVAGLKIGLNTIQTFQDYTKEIDILCSKTNNINELDFRYITKCKASGTSTKAISDIDKMRFIGKIGKSATILDKTSFSEQSYLTNNNCKLEATKSFLSARTNNCLISGRWCYELQTITNGLMQIGWCQWTTPFTQQEGVGDDLTSYAVDGWRRVKWNKKRENFGEWFDCGDIIGVCLDWDKHIVDYYLNGKLWGTAFQEIPVGPNIAYFPGISLSKGEKCRFNFGQTPMCYKYSNYEPIDIPIDTINGITESTQTILDLLWFKILDILIDRNIEQFEKIMISYKMFNYLVTVSFRNWYTLHEVLIPFLCKWSGSKNIYLQVFFEICLKDIQIHVERKEFIEFFFDNLTNSIEHYGLRGEAGIKKWKELISWFKSLWSIHVVMNVWLELANLKHYKNIFNSNCIRYGEYFDFLKAKYDITEAQHPWSQIKQIVEKEFIAKDGQRINNLETIYFTEFSEIIKVILTDKTKFYEDKTWKDLFNELLRTGYGLSSFNDIFNVLNIVNDFGGDEQIFFKNIYYNLLYLFCNNYINIPFEQLSTEPWFYRTNQDAIYADEIGWGGTISHVTTEYLNKIEPKLIIKNDMFYADFLHKLIRLSNDLFIPLWWKRFEKMHIRHKSQQLKSITSLDHGATLFEEVFRKHFYLFSHQSQVIFYQISFFIIKYWNWLREQNVNILYFIPNNVIELPFSLCKVLLWLRSSVLMDKAERSAINATSSHFASDDYIKQILHFYLYLFSDSKILNPELRENFLVKVNFFMKKSVWKSYWEKDEIAFDYLIRGLLNDIKGDALSNYACQILLKIITPLCFGYTTEHENTLLAENVQKYFVGNFNMFIDFWNNYSKFINQVMTEFAISWSEITKELHNPMSLLSDANKASKLQGLATSYNNMCDLLRITEFFLVIFPDEFLEVKTLNYIHWINIIKNLSVRIIAKPFINNLIEVSKILSASHSGNSIEVSKKKINLLSFGFVTVGLFLKISNARNNKNFPEFLIKLANTPDLVIEPFLDLYGLLDGIVKDTKLKSDWVVYYEFVKEIKEIRLKYEISQEEMNKMWDEEKMCILCYARLADVSIWPCKHVACEECMEQYRSEKNTCFICNQMIIGVTKNNWSENVAWGGKMDIDNE